MTVRGEIFSAQSSERYVQTEWAGGWTYAVIGFGEAARMLTEQRRKMGASVDQIGLAVFYLQRHRVELILKQTLIDLGEEPIRVIKPGHDLAALWALLKARLQSDDPGEWDTLERDHGDFVSVMHEADSSSFSYRYPVDKSGSHSVRPDYIDLDALQHHVERFESGLHGYLDWLSEARMAEPEFDDW
jgi:hypothetical protein